MITVHLLLLILSAACFFCAAIGVVSGRVNLVAAGLFLFVLSMVLV